MTSVTIMTIEAWDTLSDTVKEQASVDSERETGNANKVRSLDHDELSVVYDDYHPLVYKYIYRRVGNIEVARDLTAEVFSRLLEAVHKGTGPSVSIRAWLFRVAHNIVIDHYRRRNSNQHLPIEEQVSGNNPDPEERAETNRQIDEIREALSLLTPDQQQVLALKFLEGLSNSEVAEIIGKTVGAVKALQHRALSSLQKQLIRVDEEVPS